MVIPQMKLPRRPFHSLKIKSKAAAAGPLRYLAEEEAAAEIDIS